MWIAAGRLAAWRSLLQQEIAARQQQLIAEPWTHRKPIWTPGPVEIRFDDLMRALFAQRTSLFDPLELAPDRQGDAAAQWSAVVASAPEPSTTLSYAHGRRWAWIIEENPDLSLDAATILRAMPARVLVGVSAMLPMVLEGLLTLGEGVVDVTRRIGAQIGPAFGDVPPAWLERDLSPDAITAALRAHRGVALVGPPGSGKRSLLDRWERTHPLLSLSVIASGERSRSSHA
ncbi:MAG: hypothetical protein AAFV53_31070, partial [Myxococcota bacterium]